MRWPWVLLLTALALSATSGVWADEDAGVEDAEEPVVEDRAFLIARKYLKADQFMVNKQPATVVIELHNAGDRRAACPCGRPAARGVGAVGGKISTQHTGSRIGEALYVATHLQTSWCVCVRTLLQICALVSAETPCACAACVLRAVAVLISCCAYVHTRRACVRAGLMRGPSSRLAPPLTSVA